jgi:hypothetical protein
MGGDGDIRGAAIDSVIAVGVNGVVETFVEHLGEMYAVLMG